MHTLPRKGPAASADDRSGWVLVTGRARSVQTRVGVTPLANFGVPVMAGQQPTTKTAEVALDYHLGLAGCPPPTWNVRLRHTAAGSIKPASAPRGRRGGRQLIQGTDQEYPRGWRLL
jgi:hypothetical protein